jgi:putative MATE family efflux protein
LNAPELRPRSLDRELARLAVPALGALAAEPLYVLVDTAVVGHLGTAPLGGLAVAGTVLTTSFFLCNFLAYGTTGAVARRHGAGDEAGAAAVGVQALWLGGGLGVVLAVLGLVLGGAAVGLLGGDGDVRAPAETYLRISALGAPAVLVTLGGTGWLRGLQDTRTPLLVALGANLVNLVLEVTWIYGFDGGIAASAWSTVLAQYLGAAFFVVAVLRAAGPARPDGTIIRSLLVTGRHLFIRTGSLLAAFAVGTAVASRIGTVAVAAHQIAFQLWSFLALVLDALAIAAQSLVGRMLGAGDVAGARAASDRLLRWGVVFGVAAGLAVVAVRPVLPALFTDDPAVRGALLAVLWFVAAQQPLNAAVFVLDGVLIGAGDLRYLAGAMAAASALFIPAAAVVLALDLSLSWLWVALTLLMVARLAGVGLRFRSGRWAVVGAVR